MDPDAKSALSSMQPLPMVFPLQTVSAESGNSYLPTPVKVLAGGGEESCPQKLKASRGGAGVFS